MPTVRPDADGLAADYRSAGFGGRLGWGRSPALVVVDVCRAYLEPSSPLYAGVEDAVASAARVVAAARAGAAPVLWTRVHAETGSTFARKVPSLALFDTDLGDFPTSCCPVEGERVITKGWASAFFRTGLADALDAARVDTVVLVGLSTSGCIRASAVDAVSYGFAPMVVRDAVGDRAAAPHDQSLFDLDAKYADVVSETEAVEHLRGGPT